MSTAARVRQEMRRFEASLPGLSPLYVVSVHDNEELAYRAGLETFGRHGGYEIAKVADPRVVPLPAALAYQPIRARRPERHVSVIDDRLPRHDRS